MNNIKKFIFTSFLTVAVLAQSYIVWSVSSMDTTKPASTDKVSVLDDYIREDRAKINEIISNIPDIANYEYVTGAASPTSGDKIIVDTSATPATITLPTTPTIGDYITLVDPKRTWPTNNVTLDRNGEKINGVAANVVLSSGLSWTLTYVSNAYGWSTVSGGLTINSLSPSLPVSTDANANLQTESASDFRTTIGVTSLLAAKAPLDSPVFTNTVTINTIRYCDTFAQLTTALADATVTDIVLTGAMTVSGATNLSKHTVFTANSVLTVPNGVTLNISAPIDAGNFQIFNCTGSGEVVATITQPLNPMWWGAVASYSTDSTAAFQAWSAALDDNSIGVIPPGVYAVDGNAIAIDANKVSIYAYGVTIRQDSSGAVTVDLNSGALADESHVTHEVYWSGGRITNNLDAASNTNTGIKARGITRGGIKDVFGEKHGTTFIDMAPRENFYIVGCNGYLNYRHVHLPDWVTTAGGNPQIIWIQHCGFSTHSYRGIDLEGDSIDIIITNNSFIGTDAIVINTGKNVNGQQVVLRGNSYEQGTEDEFYVRTVQNNSKYLYGLKIEDSFNEALPKAIKLVAVRGAQINSKMTSQKNGLIELDSQCTAVKIWADPYNNFIGNAVFTRAVFNDCARSQITLIPEIFHRDPAPLTDWNAGTGLNDGTGTLVLNPYVLVLTGGSGTFEVGEEVTGSVSGATATVTRWEATTKTLYIEDADTDPTPFTPSSDTITGTDSGATGTLSVGTGESLITTGWTGTTSPCRILPPKRWRMVMRARDSGSAIGDPYMIVKDASASSNNYSNGIFFSGTANDVWQNTTVLPAADSNGNLAYAIEASGSGTFDVYLAVIGMEF